MPDSDPTTPLGGMRKRDEIYGIIYPFSEGCEHGVCIANRAGQTASMRICSYGYGGIVPRSLIGTVVRRARVSVGAADSQCTGTSNAGEKPETQREEAARDLASRVDSRSTAFSVTTLIEQEIALTIEQLDRTRALAKRNLRSLCRAECYVDTELMQMEERMPRYSPEQFPERDKFHHRLFLIEAERRKHAAFHEERTQGLHRKLLTLMQKHKQLSTTP